MIKCRVHYQQIQQVRRIKEVIRVVESVEQVQVQTDAEGAGKSGQEEHDRATSPLASVPLF